MTTPLDQLNAQLQSSQGHVRVCPLDEIHTQLGKTTRLNPPFNEAAIDRILDDWVFLSITDFGITRYHLMGDVLPNAKTSPESYFKCCITSPIVEVNLEMGLVLTRSKSIYQLATMCERDIDLSQACAIAEVILKWRQQLDLSVNQQGQH